MKTVTQNKMQGATRLALLALVAVMTAFTSIGCGKKSSNNNPNGYYGYGANPSCPNCTGGANALLSSALGERRPGYNPTMFQIGLEFYGQYSGGYQQQYPNGQYPGGYGSSDPYANYQGMVQAQGRMRITQADNQCGIPVGDYTLTTTQAGQYQYGIIEGLIMQASGPYPLTVRLSNTFITDSNTASVAFDGRQYPNRLQNDIWINNCHYVIE